MTLSIPISVPILVPTIIFVLGVRMFGCSDVRTTRNMKNGPILLPPTTAKCTPLPMNQAGGMQTCIPLAYVVHHAPCVHTWAPNLAMATQDPSQVVAPPKPTLGPQTPSSSCALDRGVPPPSSKATKRAKHRPSRAKPRWQWPEMGANESTTRSDPLPRVARVATMGHTNDTDWASARFTRAFEHLRRLQGSPQETPPPPQGVP